MNPEKKYHKLLGFLESEIKMNGPSKTVGIYSVAEPGRPLSIKISWDSWTDVRDPSLDKLGIKAYGGQAKTKTSRRFLLDWESVDELEKIIQIIAWRLGSGYLEFIHHKPRPGSDKEVGFGLGEFFGGGSYNITKQIGETCEDQIEDAADLGYYTWYFSPMYKAVEGHAGKLYFSKKWKSDIGDLEDDGRRSSPCPWEKIRDLGFIVDAKADCGTHKFDFRLRNRKYLLRRES